jgi:hypothetical protein
MGVCREMIRMGGAGVSGAAGRVIPRTERSTLPLTCRSPWRVAKWYLRESDMMAPGRPMGGAGR